MYPFLAFAFVSLALLSGCAPKSSVLSQATPTETITPLEKFDILSQNENFDELLGLFRHNCEANLTKKVYPEACHKSLHVKEVKSQIQEKACRYNSLENNQYLTVLQRKVLY